MPWGCECLRYESQNGVQDTRSEKQKQPERDATADVASKILNAFFNPSSLKESMLILICLAYPL
jgi:hypothetical protein